MNTCRIVRCLMILLKHCKVHFGLNFNSHVCSFDLTHNRSNSIFSETFQASTRPAGSYLGTSTDRVTLYTVITSYYRCKLRYIQSLRVITDVSYTIYSHYGL